ncbi:hypothetical protein BH11PSE13_BH11PSE13_44040 [soil metagenome]
MTINLQTLKCAECGSRALKRTGLNQYVCEHCGSVSVVEDNVSERLDRVLDQVKDAAASRLAAEQSQRQQASARRVSKIAAIVVACIVGVNVVVFMADKVFGDKKVPTRAAASSGSVVASMGDRTIPAEGLKFGEPRQVLVGSGSSARAKLLAMARNETGKPLDSPRIVAALYDGDNKVGRESETMPIGVLMAGESAPMLFDLPRDKNVTRQTFEVQRLSAPDRTVEGPRLAFSRVRLVQQGAKGDVRMVGRVVNTRKDETLTGVEAMVTLYDEAGALIGFGRGYSRAGKIEPGEREAFDVRIDRFGGAAKVAAWDYRLTYYIDSAQNGRTAVLSTDRVIRTTGGPEVFNADLHMSAADLLADESERFDLAQLELLPLAPGKSTTQDMLYLTELVNRSKDAIAVSPAAVISRYDGSKLDGTTTLSGLAYLYPGERMPIIVEPREANRITQTRVEWKPLRRAALPGARTPLEVAVTSTRAGTSSVLVNFSQRFAYKYATVTGTVKNPGDRIVRKTTLWVSLRDREGKLTGFTLVDNLPAIAPGDSVPFEAKVDQLGRDFATVTALYQTE